MVWVLYTFMSRRSTARDSAMSSFRVCACRTLNQNLRQQLKLVFKNAICAKFTGATWDGNNSDFASKVGTKQDRILVWKLAWALSASHGFP